MADGFARAPDEVRERLRFGPFVLDPATRELWKGEVPIDLSPQPMRLLQMLARRSGRLVTRGEIREKIWGGTVVEFDQAINNAVRQVRRALGDNATDPTYIETVPRRGYRFVAAVRPDSDRRSRRQDEARPDRHRLGIAVVAIVLMAVAVTAWLSGLVVGEGERTTVAVVQTRASKWEPATEGFASTLTADLTGALKALKPRGVSVIPWTWDMAVAPNRRVTRDGEPVDVDFAVDSNIRAEGAWEAAVIVTKLPEGQQVWYRRFPVDPADPDRSVSLITEAVAGAVASNLVDDRPGG